MFLRHFAVALLSVMLFAGVAQAKDGPFPMMKAVGSWETNNANLKLEMKVYDPQGDCDGQACSVKTYITLRDNHGKVIAKGNKRQKLKNEEVSLLMTYKDSGQVFLLLIDDIYDEDKGEAVNSDKFRLSISVYDITTGHWTSGIVLNRAQ